MTNLFKFFSLAVMIGAFTACSSDDETLGVAPQYMSNKKSSVVLASVKNQPSAVQQTKTRGCDVNGNQWASKPELVTATEVSEVLHYIANNPNATVEWPGYTRYFIQHVGGAHHLYSYTDHNGALHTGINGTSGFENLQVLENSGNWQHVYNFNAGKCDNAATNNSALMTDGFKAIKAMAEYASSWVEAYKIYYYKGFYYIGLDFSTKKGDGSVPGNGIYDDWVVKIVPEGGETPDGGNDNDGDDTEEGGNTEGGDGGNEDGGNEGNDGGNEDGDDNGGNEGEGDGDNDADDDTPTVTPGQGEVEFDIHQQEHKDWHEIKTSIHLRDSVCVRVVIPIQREFIAVPDDFDIRAGWDYTNIVEREIVEYKIGEKWFTSEVLINRAPEGIEILIDGTQCKEALKMARETCNDGITFEIHNYVYAHADDAELDNELIWNWLKLTECPQTSLYQWPGFGEWCTHTYGQISSAFYPEETISYDKNAE